MNEHETHEAVVKLARRELEDHERINCWFRPEFVRALIDRLEAAHKRESGDSAKLREACANIAEYARSAQCHTEDAHVLGYLNQIEGWAKAAIAAPPRNCDVVPIEAPKAADMFHRERTLHGYDYETHEWLLAPAKEQEGGNNGR